MGGTERQRRRASVPWGLLGMLVLVALAEAALSRDDRYYTRLDNMNYRFPGEVYRGVTHNEVLCFGDSLVKMGVVPKVIEERLGKSTYNLAVAGGMPSATYILLRRVVEEGGRPTAVLVDFKPSNLSVNPRVLVRPLAELTTTRESVELNWHYGDDTFLAITILSKLLTSYRDREDIRGLVRGVVTGKPSPVFTDYQAFWRNWVQNDGAQVLPKFEGAVSDEVLKKGMKYIARHFYCEPRNDRDLARFLALAEAERLPVYWLIPPVHPKVQARLDKTGAGEEFTRYVRWMQSRFPTVRVIDARHSGYRAEEFAEVAHLNRDGALKYSAALAEVLRQPEPGRWIELPPPGDAVPALRVEDTLQSFITIKAAEETKRR